MELGGQENIEAEVTPETVLVSTASSYRELELAGLDDLSKNNDSEAYMNKLREMTQLIVDLPDKVKQAKEKDHSFADGDMRLLNEFSQMAKQALANGGDFEMSTLLVDKGATGDDGNQLEQLLERVYPENLDAKAPV